MSTIDVKIGKIWKDEDDAPLLGGDVIAARFLEDHFCDGTVGRCVVLRNLLARSMRRGNKQYERIAELEREVAELRAKTDRAIKSPDGPTMFVVSEGRKKDGER